MSLIVQATVAVAAALFIALSAVMNALFLSSLGRTAVEVGVLGAVSIASDLVKAVLPVLLVRAVMVKAWGHGAIASLLLAIAVALSLASGTGFAALTRHAVVANRDSQADALAARQTELRDIEAEIASLGVARHTAVVETEIAAQIIDRRWMMSKSCTDIMGTPQRTFCAGLATLRSEHATATARDRLAAERRGTRTKIESLQSAGAGGDSDPQAAAIAALLGVDRSMPRRVLPITVAVMLELGSVILMLLLAGPTVRGWKEPVDAPTATPVTIPVSAPHPPDLVGWQLRRNASKLSDNRGESHAR